MVNSTVYDLDPARLGTFDLVHAGDLLLHLRDPVLALQRIRSVTAGHALISDCFDPDLDPAAGHLIRYEGAWLWATWWMPSLSTLVQMVADAGFGSVRLLKIYNLPPLDSDLGPWRALMRAQP
jgi:tRNA (mo5U34)-methyltransferase